MAHKKGQGSVKNGRDSQSKRLGIKIYGGQVCSPGCIIARQRGQPVPVQRSWPASKHPHAALRCTVTRAAAR